MPSDVGEVVAAAAQYRGLGRLAEARRLLTDALGEHPDSALLLYELAAVLRADGDLPGAEAAARASIAQAPQWAPPMLRLALVMLQTSRSDDAAALASGVIAMEPDAAGAWALLALAGADRRAPRDRAIARDAYRRAIALDPQESEYRWFAAVVEHAFGDVVAARRLVEEGLALEPQSGRLLALRAEYAPVGAQPALLVDVLTANPGDDESRELLDAAVTWERRLALTPAVALPALVAAVQLAGRSPVATDLAAAASIAAGALVLRRYRRRSGVLPAGYLALRREAARGTAPATALLAVCGAGLAAGAVAAWSSPAAAAVLLALAVLVGGGAVLALLPDDGRVLATARRRRGRVRGGTAWRYGGLRQELVLWSALAVGAIGLIGLLSGVSTGPRAAAGAVAAATSAVLVLLLVEAFVAGGNAPQRYWRRLGVRYRALFATLMTLSLLVNGLAALTGTDLSDRSPAPDPDGSTIELPRATTPPTVRVPTFDVPTFSVPPLAADAPR